VGNLRLGHFSKRNAADRCVCRFSEGPADFLENLFAEIKTNDKPRTDSLWQSTLLPDHAAWFARVFGDKQGPALETTYARQLANATSGPGKTYTFVASLDTVKFVVLPLAQAAVNRPDSWAKLILLSMKAPVSAYRPKRLALRAQPATCSAIFSM